MDCGYAEAWGADWKLFKKTEDAKFYYDKQDVTHLSEKMVKVWIRQVYTKKGKIDMIKLVGPRYESLSYSINSLEYDRAGKMVRFFIDGLLFQERRRFGPRKSPG